MERGREDGDVRGRLGCALRALALLSAGAEALSSFVAAAPKAVRPLVRRELGSVDPLRYAALARPGTLLLEDGTRDEIIPRTALENMIHAAPPKTVVRWYPAGHALNARAYDEALSWLLARLGAA
jgi:predicted esterase